jgi:formylglycine-generating enzyme required for sulfatase activity
MRGKSEHEMRMSSRSGTITRLCALVAFLGLLTSCRKPAESEADSGSEKRSGDNSQPVEVVTASGVGMVYLPGGEFAMGSDKGNPDEAPVHKVKLTPFLMDKFEVTHEMFTKVQLPNPSHWQDNPKKPVERVRWRDAKLYCNERSLLEKLKPCYNEKTPDFDCDFAANGYRLPTEAEWEYACRAGGNGPEDFAQPDKLRQTAWFAGNANEKTHAVGEKKPNRWGIFDLYGNVSEWCEDVYSSEYYQKSPAIDPTGPASPGNKDVRRVMRGGSWKASADMCRPTLRQAERTGDSDACFYTDYCGFRCVRRATPEELQQSKHSAKP